MKVFNLRIFVGYEGLLTMKNITEVFNSLLLARVVGVPVRRRSGGQLAMTLVATISVIIFPFFLSTPPPLFSVAYLSHRENARIKTQKPRVRQTPCQILLAIFVFLRFS